MGIGPPESLDVTCTDLASRGWQGVLYRELDDCWNLQELHVYRQGGKKTEQSLLYKGGVLSFQILFFVISRGDFATTIGRNEASI